MPYVLVSFLLLKLVEWRSQSVADGCGGPVDERKVAFLPRIGRVWLMSKEALVASAGEGSVRPRVFSLLPSTYIGSTQIILSSSSDLVGCDFVFQIGCDGFQVKGAQLVCGSKISLILFVCPFL